MYKFLETYNLSRLNHEDIDNLNRSIMNKETESVIRNLPTKKSTERNCFTDEFYQIFKEELTPILPEHLQKIEKKETVPNYFYEASIILILKQRHHKKRKRQANSLRF